MLALASSTWRPDKEGAERRAEWMRGQGWKVRLKRGRGKKRGWYVIPVGLQKAKIEQLKEEGWRLSLSKDRFGLIVEGTRRRMRERR